MNGYSTGLWTHEAYSNTEKAISGHELFLPFSIVHKVWLKTKPSIQPVVFGYALWWRFRDSQVEFSERSRWPLPSFLIFFSFFDLALELFYSLSSLSFIHVSILTIGFPKATRSTPTSSDSFGQWQPLLNCLSNTIFVILYMDRICKWDRVRIALLPVACCRTSFFLLLLLFTFQKNAKPIRFLVI